MSFLTLTKLKKTYPDGTEAVKGLDLAIGEGEFVVFLGPSGCGKTTTLRMIAGLEIPTAGRIQMANQDVTHHPPSRRDVGFVFQFYALYPHMTVRQNIAFPLENIGLSPDEIETTLSRVSEGLGVTPLLDLFPRQLSGGDQQRVSLARAMVRKPAVYLMDEPLGTLDADHRLELREFIRQQQMALSVTAIYVTHDQEEAMSLADRMVVMNAGEICQVGAPSEVYHHPASLFVANFVGSPGMNLVHGFISSTESGSQFRRKNSNIGISLGAREKSGEAILGIRPEFITPRESGLPASVTLNEYLGGHRIIHLDTPLGNLVMRSPQNQPLGVGTPLQIDLDRDHILLFDPDSGTQLA
ncbi:MAG: ABC transporter ATP-binding protein [bacterium]|nr:ABC transporter ATP-binding protein [bacterium]